MNRHVELITDTRAFASLWEECAQGRGKHAYIFSSRDFDALETLAALYICLSENGRTDEWMLRRIFDGAYTDIVRLPREEKNGKMDVEEVSYLTDSAYLLPVELRAKYYIVAPREPLSTAVQNKLLKTLEEPPASARFILFSSGYDLLPTITSRCAFLRLEEFSVEKIERALREDGVEERRALFAAAIAHGSFSAARAIASDEGYAGTYEHAVNFLLSVKRSPQILPIASAVLADKDRLDAFIDYLEIILRDAAAYEACGIDAIVLKPAARDIREVAKEYSMRTVLAVMPLFTRARERMKLYGNAASIVDELLFAILEVKAKCLK